MNYIIGIDGGGTKTAAVVTDMDGNIVCEATGGPSNFLVFGIEQVVQTLFELISLAKEKAGCDFKDISSIVLGTAGAGRRGDAERLESAFLEYASKQGAEIRNFGVESDARIALEGAFSGRPGSILIAGTGSIMFGKDTNGSIHRVGGFGRYLGDQGSGYSIGRKGLIEVSKEYDGRGLPSQLTRLVSDKFSISNTEELITAVYKNSFDVAQIAPLVIQAAQQEDEACMGIVEVECEELLLHIRAMYKKLNVPVMDLSLIGGIVTTDNFFANTFKEKVKSKLPDINIKEADYPPAMGAVIMARARIQ